MGSRAVTASGAVSRGLRWLRSSTARVVGHIIVLVRRIIRGPSEGWTTLILVMLSVLAAIWLMAGGHSVPTPGLYWLTLWGAMLGLPLAKMRIRGWPLVMAGVLAGFYLAFYQLTGLAEASSALGRHGEVGARLIAWWGVVREGGTATDRLPLSLFLLLASWLVGFVSSWALFRGRSLLGAVAPGGIVVAAHVLTIPPEGQEIRLYLYILAVFLLAARVSALQRYRNWDRRGIQYAGPRSRLRLPDALGLAVAVVLVGSLLPVTPERVESVSALWEKAGSPGILIGKEFHRVMAGAPVGRAFLGHSFGPSQVLGGRVDFTDAPAVIMRMPVPTYLSARSYDLYTGSGWESSDTERVSWESAVQDASGATGFQRLQQVDIMVTSMFPLAGGDPLFIAGSPVTLSTGYELEVMRPASYRLSVAEGATDGLAQTYLPLDVQEALQRLRHSSVTGGAPLTQEEVEALLPGDVRVASFEYASGDILELFVEREMSVRPEVVSVRTTRQLAARESYAARVLLSTATEGDLTAAGVDYPGWVLDHYLQLPSDMPARVVRLAQELTQGADTPYQKAVAIRDYLRTLDYQLDISAAPHGTDGVDYFLFGSQKGHCQYFASAMAVLLRASGVPSRMVAGYAPEEVIAGPSDGWQALYTFVARNSHAWCEVFFPTYGWIAFEPTPSYAALTRGEAIPVPPLGGDDIHDFSGMFEDIGPIPGMPDPAGVPSGDAAVDALPPDDYAGRVDAATPIRALTLGIIAGVAVMGVFVWLWRRRMLGQVLEPRVAYARMWHFAALSRLAPEVSSTPNEWGSALAAAVPDVSADISRIVDTYVRVCYGLHNVTDDDRLRITDAWPRVRNALLRRAFHGLLPRRPRAG